MTIEKHVSLDPYLFETYSEFIQAIACTQRDYHNSIVPVWRILESKHYCTRREWEEMRESYLDVKSILEL